MADQKKPETVADDDLENAQGGFGTWATTSTTGVKQARKDGDGFGTWGTATTTGLKQPGTNMEVVNEDE